MSTSFVEFRGRGFWDTDSRIELLLFLVLQENGRDGSPSALAPKLVEAWTVQFQNAFTGCHCLELDQFAHDDSTRDAILGLLARIEARSDVLDRADLEREGVGSSGRSGEWARSIPVPWLHESARQLARLLRGEVLTHAGDAEAVSWMRPLPPL